MKRKQRVTTAISLLWFICIVPMSHGTICGTGYESAQFPLFEKVILHGTGETCSGKDAEKRPFAKNNFYGRPGISFYYEKEKRVQNWVIRNGKYFGEYENQDYTGDKLYGLITSVEIPHYRLDQALSAWNPYKIVFRCIERQRTKIVLENSLEHWVYRVRKCAYQTDGTIRYLSPWAESECRQKKVDVLISGLPKGALEEGQDFYVKSSYRRWKDGPGVESDLTERWPYHSAVIKNGRAKNLSIQVCTQDPSFYLALQLGPRITEPHSDGEEKRHVVEEIEFPIQAFDQSVINAQFGGSSK